MSWEPIVLCVLCVLAFAAAAAHGTAGQAGRLANLARAGRHPLEARFRRISERLSYFSLIGGCLVWASLIRLPDVIQMPVILFGFMGLISPFATWSWWSSKQRGLGIPDGDEIFVDRLVSAVRLGMRGDFKGAVSTMASATRWAPDRDEDSPTAYSLACLAPAMRAQLAHFELAAQGKWDPQRGDPRTLFVTVGRVDGRHLPTGVQRLRVKQRGDLIPVSSRLLPASPESDGNTRAWVFFVRGGRQPVAVFPRRVAQVA